MKISPMRSSIDKAIAKARQSNPLEPKNYEALQPKQQQMQLQQPIVRPKILTTRVTKHTKAVSEMRLKPNLALMNADLGIKELSIVSSQAEIEGRPFPLRIGKIISQQPMTPYLRNALGLDYSCNPNLFLLDP